MDEEEEEWEFEEEEGEEEDVDEEDAAQVWSAHCKQQTQQQKTEYVSQRHSQQVYAILSCAA